MISGDLHNVGDLALLLQTAYGLRTLAGIEAVAVRQWGAMPPLVLEQLAGAGIALVSGKRPRRLLAAATGRLVIVGGGQMVRDNSSWRALLGLAAAMRWARISGGRTAVIGCGVDRLTRPLHRRLWRDMLRGAALVTVRDEASAAAAVAIAGADRGLQITADLMFLPSPLHPLLEQRGGPPHVVVAPCIDASERRSIATGRLAAMAVQACEAAGIGRVCVVAQDARADMDARVVGEIAEAVRRLRPALAVEVIAAARLDTVLHAYARSALTITNRLHPVIFSLIGQRPILIIDDGTPKLALPAERFGLERLSNEAAAIPAAMLARLQTEMAEGPPVGRRQALDGAKAAAAANFAWLCAVPGRLSGAAPPLPSAAPAPPAASPG